MEVDKIKDSVKNYLDDRLKNPYFASVIAVWLITNRVLVFGLFNFESTLTLEQRTSWVHQQFKQFEWYGIGGFYMVAIWSLFWGYFVMILMNQLNGFGKIIFKWVNRNIINLLRKIDPASWVSIKEHFALKKIVADLEDNVNKRKGENIQLQKEYEISEDKIVVLEEKKKELEIDLDQKKESIREYDTKIQELLKATPKVEVQVEGNDISEIFKGKWRNDYVFSDGREGDEIFEIIEGNKYIKDGEHIFNIEKVEINKKENRVKFTKVGVNDDRVAVNFLTIVNKKTLIGMEDKGTRITYSRID